MTTPAPKQPIGPASAQAPAPPPAATTPPETPPAEVRPAPRQREAQPDLFALIIGPPKYGKSSLASRYIRDELASGGWVFAHDPDHQYAGLTVYYDTAAAWDKAARAAAAANKPMPRGASLGGDIGDVIALIKRLGDKFNTQWSHRMSILFVADEGSLLDSKAGSIDPDDAELFSRRRHRGLRIILLLQYPTMLDRRVVVLTTDIILFAQTEDDVPRLEKLLFLPKGTLCALPSLPPHIYVHCRRGEGLVK